jgi:hypothetical protein
MKFMLLIFSLTTHSPEIAVSEVPMLDLAECQTIAEKLPIAALNAAQADLSPTAIGAACAPNPEGYPVPIPIPDRGE